MNDVKADASVKRKEIMRGGTLAQLPVFLAVAEEQSFSRAAKRLGVSTSAVSQAVSRLEEEVGVALLLRTTRSVNLTDAGRTLAAEVGPSVIATANALAGVRAAAAEPTGRLRLNVPRLARFVLAPLLAAYAERHPKVQVDVIVDDRNVDIVRDGFDAGIRLREAVQKEMVTVRLSPAFKFVVVGSKRYLAARGRPKHPRELVDHACLSWRWSTSGETYRWEFVDRGRDFEVAVDGPIRSNDADMLMEAATRDFGLTYVAAPEVERELASGRLEAVLEKWTPEVSGLFLYYPRSAQRVPKLSAFVALARETMKARG